MLEFDGQALDPAIVSAQPMKPAQTVGLQQMGLVSGERQRNLSWSVLRVRPVPEVEPDLLQENMRNSKNGITLFI
jgi:hypothetical protein